MLYVKHGNTPLIELPYYYRDVASLTERYRWEAQRQEVEEERKKQRTRERLEKAGIRT